MSLSVRQNICSWRLSLNGARAPAVTKDWLPHTENLHLISSPSSSASPQLESKTAELGGKEEKEEKEENEIDGENEQSKG